MLLPPDLAADERPPSAVIVDCVGALGVLVSGLVLVASPLAALFFYADYEDHRSGIDHAAVTPAELRAGLLGVAAFAAVAGWILVASIQLLRRRPWARWALLATYAVLAGLELEQAIGDSDPQPLIVLALVVGGLAVLLALPAVGDHIAAEHARRRRR